MGVAPATSRVIAQAHKYPAGLSFALLTLACEATHSLGAALKAYQQMTLLSLRPFSHKEGCPAQGETNSLGRWSVLSS